jgi:hypothetical protein
MKLEFSRQIFEKYSNVKFHENPSRGNLFFPCGRTDGQTDVTELIASIRDFVTAPQMLFCVHVCKGPKDQTKNSKLFLLGSYEET